jgi:tRNA (adenine-N(1)-)-methyltransferase non-catalytic subunit
MQSSGNTPSVLNGSTEGEVVEPIVEQDEDVQAVDTAVSDEKAQLSTEQPTDMEVSKPLDGQDENASLGK